MDIIDLLPDRGFHTEPYQHTPSGGVGQGKVYVYGPNGDTDPGRVLVDVEVYNSGSVDLYVATSGLRGAVGNTATYSLAKAGRSVFLPGFVESLAIGNPNGGGGAGAFTINASRLRALNSAALQSHPGHGEYLFRLTGTPNATKTVSRTIREAITVSGIYGWSKTIPSSAAGTYLGSCSGGGNNLFSTATINLETALTTVALYTATLTATPANLDLDPGDALSFTGVSDNADLAAGDLCFAVAYTLR